MKKWIGLLLCVLALMTGAGMAETEDAFVVINPADTTGAVTVNGRVFTPVPAAQYNLIIPNGVQFKSQSLEPGSIRLEVNTEATDWFKAAAHTGTGWGDTQILWQVRVPQYKGPDDTEPVTPTYVQKVFGPAEDITGPFDEHEQRGDFVPLKIDPVWGNATDPGGMPYTENGLRIASTIPEMGLLVPKAISDEVWIGWYDQNKALLGYQKLVVNITHSQEEAFEAQVSNPAAADRICADSRYTPAVSAGSVNYAVSGHGVEMVTGIRAPEGASKYLIEGNLKSPTPTSPSPLPSDGCAPVLLESDGGRPVHSQFRCISFYKEEEGQDVWMETVTVVIGYQSGEEILPWPAYQTGFRIQGAGDLIIENGAKDAGYSLEYNEQNGKLTARFSGETTGGKPGEVRLKLWVPTDEIRSYRVVKTGGNNVLGQGVRSPESLFRQFDLEYRSGPAPVTGSTVLIEVDEPFREVRTQDSQMVIYTPDFSANVQGHADLYAVQWFNADGEMMNGATFYFWQQLEDFTLIHKDEPVRQLKDLTSAVTRPTIVVPNGVPYQNLFLRMAAYITDRQDAWAYDLSLVDANGDAVKPNAPVWVYLPYPEGHTPGRKYKISHYMNGSFVTGELGVSEELEVQDALYGLMFETSSFSPFILSVDDGQPAHPAAPPATGDATPVALLCALLTASLSAGLLLRRKARRG